MNAAARPRQHGHAAPGATRQDVKRWIVAARNPHGDPLDAPARGPSRAVRDHRKARSGTPVSTPPSRSARYAPATVPAEHPTSRANTLTPGSGTPPDHRPAAISRARRLASSEVLICIGTEWHRRLRSCLRHRRNGRPRPGLVCGRNVGTTNASTPATLPTVIRASRLRVYQRSVRPCQAGASLGRWRVLRPRPEAPTTRCPAARPRIPVRCRRDRGRAPCARRSSR